jgi:hypothetical protein
MLNVQDGPERLLLCVALVSMEQGCATTYNVPSLQDHYYASWRERPEVVASNSALKNPAS